ncbi:MAG TPA: DUF3883 domain-containing protein [Burkholderiaceae bacterium]|nr:DUF3883 domain-containing protein [Burkholderiaceae bacterium]
MGTFQTSDWSRAEVEAIVDDYLHMLTQELSGQQYNKTAHRKALSLRLNGRSDGSIEFKHANISAVLIDLGCPYIVGYKPRSNVQSLLYEVVEDRIANNPLFDQAARSAVEQPAVAPLHADFESVLVDAPVMSARAEQERAAYRPRFRVVRDYLEREARNRSLGEAGEGFVVACERDRLWKLGCARLSDRVEHVAATRGDGLGFDVLSFEADGRERFIEVKTTAFGKQMPFYITRNEVEFSKVYAPQFRLYRLFEFRRAPRMFALEGSVSERCLLDPVTYLVRV